MSDQRPAAEEDLGLEGEAEWQRLRRQLELAEGFWLGFIFSDSSRSAGVLSRRTEYLLRGQTRKLLRFTPETPEELTGVLASLFTSEAAAAGGCWVEALRTDSPGENERPWQNAWLTLVSRMNERRDSLRRHLGGGLVLVAPPALKPLIREAASDLWSIRALVVDVPLATAPLPRREPHVIEHTALDAPEIFEIPSLSDAEFLLAESERLLAKTAEDDIRRLEPLLQRTLGLLGVRRTDEAVETARSARELIRRYPNLSPKIEAHCLYMLAKAEEAFGDVAAAAGHLEQAVDLLRDHQERRFLILQTELARLAIQRGDLKAASRAYDACAILARQLRDNSGSSVESLRDLSIALNNVGKVRRDLGELRAAADAFEESLSLSRQLRSSLGDSPQVLRDLSVSLDNAGRVRLDLGELRAAAAAFEECLALRRQLRSSLGDAPQVLRGLSVSLDNVGRVRSDLGELRAAAAAFEESLSLSRQLRSSLGDAPQVLRDLSVSLDSVGRVRSDLGKLRAAAAAFEESLALRRQLRASLGDAPQVLRDLSASLNDVGNVRRDLGELSAAAAAFEESLSLSRQFRQRLGDIPRVLADLSLILKNLASVRERLGDKAGAAQARLEAQTLQPPSSE